MRQQLSPLSTLPVLGVGLGYRPGFGRELFADGTGVDFLEITIEHYLDAPADKRRELDALQERFTLIPHGLNLSLGSAEGLDEAYLERVAELIERLNPPWWSEHVCFTRAGGIEIGHLAPLPFTDQALDVLCANLAQVQQVIPRPLILENISYLLALGGDYDEAGFLAALLRRSGCGLLLDVTNLYINAVNHGYDLESYLAALPAEQVVQLHFVGEQRGHDLLIDSHARPVSEQIWAVMEQVLQRFAIKGAILERDEALPPLAELKAELAQARDLGRRAGRW